MRLASPGYESTKKLDIIRNKYFNSLSQLSFPVLNSEIMQATCNNHNQVRESFFRIAQHIFHNAWALDASNCMFDFDANSGEVTIVSFLWRG